MKVSALILETIRRIHKDTVIIVKVGNFYNVFKDDAYILSYLFGYKLNKKYDNVEMTGFPKESINKVMAKLEHKKINYLVINKSNNYEVDEKVINDSVNTYKQVLVKAKSYVNSKSKVEKIYKYLLNNLNNKKLIDEIEKIINERRKI